MWKYLLFIIMMQYAQCNGWEYDGDDPHVEVGYIWYDGTEWVDYNLEGEL